MQGLRRLIEQTEDFINENPSDIAFTHKSGTPDGAGGTIYNDEPSDPITVRLVPQNPTTASEQRTFDGEVLKTVYSIVAMPDADVREGDSFTADGARHEIAVVVGIGGYEIRAEAVRRG